MRNGKLNAMKIFLKILIGLLLILAVSVPSAIFLEFELSFIINSVWGCLIGTLTGIYLSKS